MAEEHYKDFHKKYASKLRAVRIDTLDDFIAYKGDRPSGIGKGPWDAMMALVEDRRADQTYSHSWYNRNVLVFVDGYAERGIVKQLVIQKTRVSMCVQYWNSVRRAKCTELMEPQSLLSMEYRASSGPFPSYDTDDEMDPEDEVICLDTNDGIPPLLPPLRVNETRDFLTNADWQRLNITIRDTNRSIV
ncbi:MAG: hypothetical protein CMK92_03840 [Pseudomonas sp.]|nr:hypothetical protein [Pseudomonas sp.]